MTRVVIVLFPPSGSDRCHRVVIVLFPPSGSDRCHRVVIVLFPPSGSDRVVIVRVGPCSNCVAVFTLHPVNLYCFLVNERDLVLVMNVTWSG